MRYLVVCLLLGGCVTTPQYVVTTRYLLDPAVEVTPVETAPFSLGIRPLEAARPYRQQMVIRETAHRLGAYEHAEWAELPAERLTRALADAVLATQRFQDVGQTFDVGAPDLLLMGRIRRFDEVRTQSPPAAECEIRIELRTGLGREAVWAETLSVSEPIKEGGGPPAFAEAMSRACGRLISDAAKRLSEIPLPQAERK